jgi:hypothetical protein
MVAFQRMQRSLNADPDEHVFRRRQLEDVFITRARRGSG